MIKGLILWAKNKKRVKISENRKITIAYFIDFLADRKGATGGTERQLLEMINRLDPERYRVILFCLQKFNDCSIWDDFNHKKILLNIYSFKSIQVFRALTKVVFVLKKESVDIVQTYFHDATIFGVAAAKISKVPIIISSRRDLGFWYGEKIPKLFSLANSLTHNFIVNSESVRKAASENEKLPFEKIKVIPNGIDCKNIFSIEKTNLSEEFPLISSNDKIVGIVANYSRKVKRVDLFLDAAALVLSKYERVTFLIVGGGKLENELKKQSKSLGIEHKVIFSGPKENPIAYMKCFNVGVLCSDSEGFSNTILEYMLAKIPVVATAVGGNNEIIVDGVTGRLIPPNAPIDLADAICSLLEDSKLSERLSKSGFDRVNRKYHWDRIIKETQDFYLELLESKNT